MHGSTACARSASFCAAGTGSEWGSGREGLEGGAHRLAAGMSWRGRAKELTEHGVCMTHCWTERRSMCGTRI